MENNLVKFLMIFSVWSMISCNNIERLDTTKIKSQMDAYKIKKVSESDVLVVLNDKGNEVERFFLKLDCSAQLDSLNEVGGVKIEQVFPDSYVALNQKEQGVIEALAYSLKQKEQFNATPQKLSETAYAYYFYNDKAKCGDSTKVGDFFWRVLFQKEILVNAIN